MKIDGEKFLEKSVPSIARNLSIAISSSALQTRFRYFMENNQVGAKRA